VPARAKDEGHRRTVGAEVEHVPQLKEPWTRFVARKLSIIPEDAIRGWSLVHVEFLVELWESTTSGPRSQFLYESVG